MGFNNNNVVSHFVCGLTGTEYMLNCCNLGVSPSPLGNFGKHCVCIYESCRLGSIFEMGDMFKIAHGWR